MRNLESIYQILITLRDGGLGVLCFVWLNRAIKVARVLGLLRSSGFTSRLKNMPEPEPIKEDETGRHNMMILDGLLVKPATRFEDNDGGALSISLETPV